MYEDTLQAVTWGTAFSIVDAVCCEKEERHDIHIDKDKVIPSFFKFECTHGNCKQCGIGVRLGILFLLQSLSSDLVEDMIKVKVWADSPCQGVNKKGEQNKQ